MDVAARRSGNSGHCGGGRPGGTGFTLVELLIVAGIVSLLASMAAPPLARVNDMAGKAKCLSNLRSTGVAACAHAVDNNLHIPRGNGREAARVVTGLSRPPRSRYAGSLSP